MKNTKRLFLSICIGLSAVALSASAITLAWFAKPTSATEKTLDGEIGLRGYFFAGNGQEATPYEIVSPVHLYNLSRLQNLGVFSKKTYFRVGHIFETGESPKCINIVDGEATYSTTLDMSGVTIRPIGNEATPFFGTFDGRGIIIENLTVEGTPEDIGMFGYVGCKGTVKSVDPLSGQTVVEPFAHGEVKNLICDNITIRSVGHVDDDSDIDDLFSQQTYAEDVHGVDNAFETSGELASGTSLDFYEWNTSTSTYDVNHLTGWNGNGSGGAFTNINSETKVVVSGDQKIHKGYFVPHFPSGTPFTFSWQASSPLITTSDALNRDLNGDTVADDLIVIDLETIATSEDFNNVNSNLEVDTRLYLVASLEVGGYSYSRVIQSYSLAFISNYSSYAQGNYQVNIFCDYAQTSRPDDYNTSYHHGNNIGFVAGHVDGKITDCYVYRGKYEINYNTSPYNGNAPIFTETATGLIGEISANVANELDPELNLTDSGDIGVMNFSGIYDLIRRDAEPDDQTYAGSSGGRNYMAIDPFLVSTHTRFADYLRYADTLSGKKYVIKTNVAVGSDWESYTVPATPDASLNQVDFLNNKVIEDEEDANRQLGVFKIVTPYAERGNSYPLEDNLGDCVIKKGTPQTDVYFSTAEFDWSKTDLDTEDDWWDVDPIVPHRATTTPSYSDLTSFEYPFGKDYNYVFKLDLTEKDVLGTNNYMYNTNNPFLRNYLSSLLIDNKGNAIAPGTSRFGFYFRSSNNALMDNLSSYMPVGKPGAKSQYGTFEDGSPRYLPSNSIVFQIENPNGANVSVVGSNADISIYEYDPTVPGGGVTEKYTMKSSGNNTIDSNRYFTYSGVTGGPTETQVTPLNSDMDDASGVLYGHIFRLEGNGKHYVIGASSKSAAKANIYYLAVQGQTAGTIGSATTIGVGDLTVRNVEFLVNAPAYASNFPSNLASDIAKFSFKANFNNLYHNKQFTINVEDADPHLRLIYNNSDVFITYLMTYARPTIVPYYINGVLKSNDTLVVIGGS